VAPRKRDGVGSSRMGIAHHGEESIFGSVLGLGRTFGFRDGRHWRRPGRRWGSVMKLDVVGVEQTGMRERSGREASARHLNGYRVILRPWAQCPRRSHIQFQ
jgi:hypothetical protein